MTTTEQIMKARGYERQADGSFSRPDSERRPGKGTQGCKKEPHSAYLPAKNTNAFAAKFEAMWHELKGPYLTPEHRFHKDRKWRYDYAHVHTLIAIELEGGIHTNGAHSRPAGYKKDCEKYNAAGLDGWIVFRLCTGMVTRANLEPIIELIRRKISEP